MARTLDTGDLRRVRIGFLLIAVVVLVSFVAFFIDSLERATVEGPRITVTTTSAPGVEPGTGVWVAGRPVGRVLSVEFRPPENGQDRIVIEAVLQRGVDEVLRADATVTIQAGALLEPVILAIQPGTGSAPRRDPDLPLRAITEQLDPDALLAMAEELGQAGERLRAQASRVKSMIARENGTLALLADDPDVLAEAGALMARVDTIMRRDVPNGTVSRFARDTVISNRLLRIRQRLANLDTLHARERAVRSLEETMTALSAFQDRLVRISQRLDEGEGTVGRALRDGEIDRQLALLRARLDSTMVEFMKRPDRWLRVKVF